MLDAAVRETCDSAMSANALQKSAMRPCQDSPCMAHLRTRLCCEQVRAASVHVDHNTPDACDQHTTCWAVVARPVCFHGHAGCNLLPDGFTCGLIHVFVLLVLAFGFGEGHNLIDRLVCEMSKGEQQSRGTGRGTSWWQRHGVGWAVKARLLMCGQEHRQATDSHDGCV